MKIYGQPMIDAAFLKPNEDKIPELLLLGKLHIVTHADFDGKNYEVQYIMYEGVKYVMKVTCTGRWMDERAEHAPERSPFHGTKLHRDIFSERGELKFEL